MLSFGRLPRGNQGLEAMVWAAMYGNGYALHDGLLGLAYCGRRNPYRH
jgi:hypothetical protein